MNEATAKAGLCQIFVGERARECRRSGLAHRVSFALSPTIKIKVLIATDLVLCPLHVALSKGAYRKVEPL